MTEMCFHHHFFARFFCLTFGDNYRVIQIKILHYENHEICVQNLGLTKKAQKTQTQ